MVEATPVVDLVDSATTEVVASLSEVEVGELSSSDDFAALVACAAPDAALVAVVFRAVDIAEVVSAEVVIAEVVIADVVGAAVVAADAAVAEALLTACAASVEAAEVDAGARAGAGDDAELVAAKLTASAPVSASVAVVGEVGAAAGEVVNGVALSSADAWSSVD